MLFSPASLGAVFDGLSAGDWPCRLPTGAVPPEAVFDGLSAGDWPCRLPTGVVSPGAAFDIGLSAGDWPCRLPTDVVPGSWVSPDSASAIPIMPHHGKRIIAPINSARNLCLYCQIMMDLQFI